MPNDEENSFTEGPEDFGNQSADKSLQLSLRKRSTDVLQNDKQFQRILDEHKKM